MTGPIIGIVLAALLLCSLLLPPAPSARRNRPSPVALELARMEAAGHKMEPTNYWPDLPRGHARDCPCRDSQP